MFLFPSQNDNTLYPSLSWRQYNSFMKAKVRDSLKSVYYCKQYTSRENEFLFEVANVRTLFHAFRKYLKVTNVWSFRGFPLFLVSDSTPSESLSKNMSYSHYFLQIETANKPYGSYKFIFFSLSREPQPPPLKDTHTAPLPSPLG